MAHQRNVQGSQAARPPVQRRAQRLQANISLVTAAPSRAEPRLAEFLRNAVGILWMRPEYPLINNHKARFGDRPCEAGARQPSGRWKHADQPQHREEEPKFPPQIGKAPRLADQQASRLQGKVNLAQQARQIVHKMQDVERADRIKRRAVERPLRVSSFKMQSGGCQL